jgi:hypothetical protein
MEYLRAESRNEAEYFKKVMDLTAGEKEIIDYQAPFKLFSGHFRLGAFERLNLLERETVRIY